MNTKAGGGRELDEMERKDQGEKKIGKLLEERHMRGWGWGGRAGKVRRSATMSWE